MEGLQKQARQKELREAEITREALVKLLRITIFIVQNRWAHTTTYQDFVRFVGGDLGEVVLKQTEQHKNATYLSRPTVSEFVKITGQYIKEITIDFMKLQSDFTLLLDESTDCANQSQLALIARVIVDCAIDNKFLDLIKLPRCNATSIFNEVEQFCKRNNIPLCNARFAGMDGCSTMSGVHEGVQAHFKRKCGHNIYCHCRNHRLALCFAHLIPQYPQFKAYDALLLNLFLLFKHSAVKTVIFEEVQTIYGLKSLKLIKAAVTRWLSHGKASERVLERFESLVDALNTIYEKNKEPSVLGVRDSLVKPEMIATLCFLTDVILLTNKLQVFLQGARLNFVELPAQVNQLIADLREKLRCPEAPGSYFSKVEEYINHCLYESRGARQSRAHAVFSKHDFVRDFVRPVLKDLIDQIEWAMQVPEELTGFIAFDMKNLPRHASDLDAHGVENITKLGNFYRTEYREDEREYSAYLNLKSSN